MEQGNKQGNLPRSTYCCVELGVKSRYLYPTMHVVLYSPQIPPNTGNIARLTAANNTPLHLIEPLGFELSDRYLKRSGLDYWSEVKLTVYPSWQNFLATQVASAPGKLWFFTSYATIAHWDVAYAPNDYLVFGSETTGLPDELVKDHLHSRVLIPMPNVNVRCLNLSTSVGIGLYEALRQTRITPEC